MTHNEYEYLETKVEEALRHLRKTNKRYSAAAETEGELYRRIKRITETKGDILLLETERNRIDELLEQWVEVIPSVKICDFASSPWAQGEPFCLRKSLGGLPLFIKRRPRVASLALRAIHLQVPFKGEGD